MSNNTKRLSFFAKIAQRSTALQSLLEVATGKSAVGAIAPDRQGQIGVREKHTYYTTERYQKDIEVAQAQPTPPVVVEPAGIQIALYSGSEPLGVTMNYAAISVPGETEKSTWAYGDATSQGIAGTNSSNPAVGDTVYFKSAGSSEWTETIMSSYTARVSNASLGPCISANVELEGVIQGYCVLTNPEASQAHSGCYKWTHGLGEFELYTSSAEPSANDKIYCNGSEVGTVIAYSNITSDAVSPSNDPSAESINPNLEARIKHVKEFYRGESVYFMKEVGIKRYPNHYHVAWTVPSAADGTLSATANGFPLFNGEAAIEGATIVFTATPASGKQVDQWSGLPQGATTAGNTATFTLAADVNASVTFAEAAAVDYFCITPDEANTSLDVRFYLNSEESDSNDEPELTIEYSTDKATWTEQASYTPDYITITDHEQSDKFNYVRAVEGYYVWMFGEEGAATTSRTPSQGATIYVVQEGQIVPSTYEVVSYNQGQGYISISGPTYFRGSFSQGTLIFEARQQVAFSLSGHLSTLVNGTNTLTDDLPENAFYEFMCQANVTDASGLIMPDSHLSSDCFDEMFYGCESLTKAPVLPATTLTEDCYLSMFQGCTSLVTAPDLPATTLAEYCYQSMFQNCTSLATAPALPAETLAESCYNSMFYGCTSLTSAPSLPATTLADDCYDMMFYGCSSLNEVHCAATDISATECTDYWLGNVAASGNFYGKTAAGWTEGSPSGIPSGWTFHEE